MKPTTYAVEISIFLVNNVTVRFTKIMKNLLEHLKILIFKLVESFQFFFSSKNIGLGDQPLFKKCPTQTKIIELVID